MYFIKSIEFYVYTQNGLKHCFIITHAIDDEQVSDFASCFVCKEAMDKWETQNSRVLMFCFMKYIPITGLCWANINSWPY